MLVTLSGIVIDERLLQFSNASAPMLVTLSGIVIDERLLQFSNAYSPIDVMPFSISTEVILSL